MNDLADRIYAASRTAEDIDDITTVNVVHDLLVMVEELGNEILKLRHEIGQIRDASQKRTV